MPNIKQYQIKINGLTESIDGVDSLNKQLDTLEKRINDLQGKGVSISSKGGGKTSEELSAQEQLQKQILANEKKIEIARDEDYKILLRQKQLLKDIATEQKAVVASEKIASPDNYNLNTVQGIKDRLRDLKAAMQTTDLGDVDAFKKLTDEANELNNKLKQIEQSYGVFGRSVGNYANGVTEGIKHARQELRDLKTEMQDLANKKANGIISEEEEERLKAVVHEYNNMKSTLEDANNPMDAMMDTMQSMVAIASTAKGFSAFFGLDGDKVEESLKKLMALQNAMQGLQTLQKQMQTGEGFGKYLSSANGSIDKFVAKITKAKIGVNGLEKSTKTATLAVKGFSTALKATGIGLAVWIGSEVIDGIGKFIDNLKAADKAAEEFKQTLDDVADKSLAEGIGARTDIDEFISKMKVASGSTAQEKKIIDELNKSYGDLMGHYYTLSQWFDVLQNKRENYVKLIEQEKKVEQLKTLFEETQLNKAKAEQARQQAELNKETDNGVDVSAKYAYALREEATATHAAMMASIQYRGQLFILNRLRAAMENEAAGNPESGRTTTTKTVDAEKELQNLRLKYMKDGLNKRMMQLDEEKRQTLEKLKRNSIQYLEAEKIYEEQRLKVIKDYTEQIAKSVDEMFKSIQRSGEDIELDVLKNQIEDYDLWIERISQDFPPHTFYTSLNEGTLSLAESLNERMQIQKNYNETYRKEIERSYGQQLKLQGELLKKQEEIEKQRLDDEIATLEKQKIEVNETGAWIAERLRKITDKESTEYAELLDQYVKLETARSEVDASIVKKTENLANAKLNIEKKFDAEQERLVQDNCQKLDALYVNYFDNQISNLREFNSKISREVGKQPMLDRMGFGIVNIKQTQRNYKEIVDGAKEAVREIDEQKKYLDQLFKAGLIGSESYNAILQQLGDLKVQAVDQLEQIEVASKNVIGEFINSINNYVQELGNAIQTVMQAVNDYQDYQLDKQQDYLEKSISDLENKLSEQEAILQKHKDNVNSIEDELSSARGDRRQHLIDQLNAEIAAQREAAAEQKRIEKEKQKEQDKLDELDKKRKKQEYDRNLRQILISGALATANGLATQPFVPVGIAMGALATSLAAVQYALAKKQKPYAKGGLLEGASHKEGGIPVGNTGIEVEGKEYVIRKKSTAENVPVLDFINRAERKLTLDDFIDFYSSKPKATIKNIRSKFADGGVLPNNIDIRDQISDVVMVQSEQPIYVTVKDIENGLDRVARVRELAGV